MSQIRKIHTNDAYYMTMTVVGWQEVFTRIHYQDIIIENLLFLMKNRGIRIFAYVLMPNHMHIIADCENDNYHLGKVIERYKAFTAKTLKAAIIQSEQEVRKARFQNAFAFYGSHGNHHDRDNQFWIHGNYAKHVYSLAFFHQKHEYIEMNPVRAGFVEEPHHWRLSSANENSPIPITPF